jgi:hypothetical protein
MGLKVGLCGTDFLIYAVAQAFFYVCGHMDFMVLKPIMVLAP